MDNIFEKIVRFWSICFNWIALIALVAMVGVVSVDIVGAKIFSFPLPGAVELVFLLGCGGGFLFRSTGHTIWVDIFGSIS